jgi:hypothetical protein
MSGQVATMTSEIRKGIPVYGEAVQERDQLRTFVRSGAARDAARR